MRARALAVALLAALAVLVVLPAQALAHATLERTVPSASATTSSPPKEVSLTFSEGIEPRFAIVSVTDAGGHQVTAGAPAHPPGDGTTLVVPLKDVKQGWYLVYWRVISADGHPVRGAFTFAVGPSPGPAPQFPIPSLSETAATPTLVIERWTMLLSLMIGVGLLAVPAGHRPAGGGAGRERQPAAGRHRRRRGARDLPGGDAGLPDPGDGGVRAALGDRRRRPHTPGPTLVVRPGHLRPRDRRRPARRVRGGGDLARPAAAGDPLGRRARLAVRGDRRRRRCAARPGDRRPPGHHLAGRPGPVARLRAPGLGQRLGRRARRPAAARTAAPGASAAARSWPWPCRASRAPRSSRCS